MDGKCASRIRSAILGFRVAFASLNVPVACVCFISSLQRNPVGPEVFEVTAARGGLVVTPGHSVATGSWPPEPALHCLRSRMRLWPLGGLSQEWVGARELAAGPGKALSLCFGPASRCESLTHPWKRKRLPSPGERCLPALIRRLSKGNLMGSLTGAPLWPWKSRETGSRSGPSAGTVSGRH